MKAVRWSLGKVILFLDFIIPPKVKVIRSATEQESVDREVLSLKFYQYKACPFCVKVRRAAKSLGLSIETRDALKNPTYRQELLTHGGKIKVPCLRITENGQDIWMYESSEIVKYLTERFGSQKIAA